MASMHWSYYDTMDMNHHYLETLRNYTPKEVIDLVMTM